MNPKLISAIFGLIATGAIGVAIYFSVNGSYKTGDDIATHATFTPSASPVTASPTPLVTPSPLASMTPSASPRNFLATQGLAVANLIEVIPAGGSLISVATLHNVTVDGLAKVNNLSNPNQVFAGQAIIVPDDVTATDYTILFTLNEARLAKEKAKKAAGTGSIYEDPVTATLADIRSLFGLGADTPFSSNQTENGAQTTLTTSNDTWFVSVGLEKQSDEFWVVKRIIAKAKIKTPAPSTP